jgi:uncharacterized metal-binding protein YceD (DUF177 family)
MNIPMQPEFSRPFDVTNLREEARQHIEASETECTALARRLSVDGVTSLSADLLLVREMGAVIRLSGSISASVTQTCVVSLRPVENVLQIEVNRRFGPPELVDDQESGDVAIDAEDPPDEITDGVIDLGEAVAELLALEIDPFPRLEDAEFAGYNSGASQPADKQSPFAVLEELVKKPK